MKHLFSLGNSVSIFFIALLLLSIVVVLSFDKNATSPYVSSSDIPKIELHNSIAYQINTEQLSIKISAKTAKQFEKFDEFYDVMLERKDNNVIDKITAPLAIKKDNAVFFEQGVNDVRDGYNLYSTQAVYYIDKNIIDGKNRFEIKGESQYVVGDNLYYDVKNGITKASNIKAILNTQKKK